MDFLLNLCIIVKTKLIEIVTIKQRRGFLAYHTNTFSQS